MLGWDKVAVMHGRCANPRADAGPDALSKMNARHITRSNFSIKDGFVGVGKYQILHDS
jgi:hypothetical protein